MSLALGCTVAEAQERIDSREFAAWRAYDRLEPIGPMATQAHMTYLAWHLLGALGAQVEHDKLLPPWIADDMRGEDELATKLKAYLISQSNRGKRGDNDRDTGRGGDGERVEVREGLQAGASQVPAVHPERQT